MDIFINSIEDAFLDTKDCPTLYKFKRQLLDKMNSRTEEVIDAGLTDEKIITDLIMSEYPDLHGEYRRFCEQERLAQKEKALTKFMIIGSVVWLLAMVVVYLGISFITHNWRESWLIIIAFVTVFVDTVAAVSIRKIASMRRVFHPIARVILGLAVMMSTVLVYLVTLMLFNPHDSWVIVPAGVFVMYCADAVFARATNQRVRIINYLIYVPAAMPMIYVVLCGAGFLPWSPSWILMPLSVVIDIIIIAAALINNSRYVYKQPKEDDEWNEN